MLVAKSTSTLAPHALAEVESSRPAWLSRKLFPFESKFLHVEGTRFHYLDEGHGRTLLFVHGAPMSSFMWRHQIGALRGRYRCVAVDLPGLGRSQAEVVRGKGFERNASALQAFVRELGLGDFTLIVHSTGGPSALEMAIRERRRVRGLVISNTFAWPLALVPAMKSIVRVVSSRVFAFLVVWFNLLARITASRGRRYGTLSAEERAAVLGPFRDRQARAHLSNLLYGLRAEAPFFSKLEQRLPALETVPTLLLFSVDDNGYKAGFSDRFGRLLPLHTALVLPEAAHFLTEDAPEAYTRVLAGWLTAHP